MTQHSHPPHSPEASYVLYCLIRRRLSPGGHEQFLLIDKQGHPAFPPTKFRPGEDLFHALDRPMTGDLGLPPRTFFLEKELPVIPNAGESHRYPGLTKQWFLYPVSISLTTEARLHLEQNAVQWLTLDEILSHCQEPNIRAIATFFHQKPELLTHVPLEPSMDALAGHWAASHNEGVRIARKHDIHRILDASDRAFNLRVADPYLPYQQQGLGFTWSFFTPRDKQDIHVHGLPAVEIYGVMEGRPQLWHKPMNQHGVRVWQPQLLGPGDWAEVEPLTCHLAVWLDRDGLGTVIKAAGQGELAGVGRLGISGKTACHWQTSDGPQQHCANWQQCAYPPALLKLAAEFTKTWTERDFSFVVATALEAQRVWGEV